MMKKKKISSILLRKCKSLSAKLRRSSSSASYASLRSVSAREDDTEDAAVDVFVGSSRRRYTLSARHLSHPVINALIDQAENGKEEIRVKCEVVLFDHLLWMLENADPEEVAAADGPQLEELAQLYSY